MFLKFGGVHLIPGLLIFLTFAIAEAGEGTGAARCAESFGDDKETVKVLLAEIKRLKEELIRLRSHSENQISFLYGLNHEVARHTRSILVGTILIKNQIEIGTIEDVIKRLSEIELAIVQIHEVMSGIVRLVRLGDGKLNYEDIDLSHLANRIAMNQKQSEDTLRTHSGKTVREVSYNIESGMRMIGDRVLIEILLENLMGNARKYNFREKDADIRVGAEILWRDRTLPSGDVVKAGQRAYFVEDNGSGFDMSFASQIFQIFKRLHSAAIPGSGVGLALSQKIVANHNGFIWAESAVDKGTRFYFTIGD